MWWSFVIAYVATELVVASHQHATPESFYYTAAVVEYSYNHDNMTLNLEQYLHFMNEAHLQDVDVIVFPEITITNVSIPIPAIPRQRSETAPCDNATSYHDVLVKMSYGARKYKLYVVINTFELLDCQEQNENLKNPECGGNGIYEFVTNVVFDRNGYIIDKYRKKYMDSNPTWSPSPDQTVIGIFDSDFGVRFGHFVCFDLMFQIPSVQVIQKYGITDILYSSKWQNEIPFLAAAAFHNGYAHAFNVNFIASDSTFPPDGSGGSGIYSGIAGPLISFTPRSGNNTMLVSRVPKQPGRVTWPLVGPIDSDPGTLDEIKSPKYYKVPCYVGQDLEENEELQVIKLEDGNVTCTFHVQLKILERNITEDMKFYRYRAVVVDEMYNDCNHYVHTTVCCIVACTNNSLSSCGNRFLRHENLTTVYEFTTLRVTSDAPLAQFSAKHECDDAVYYPCTLTHNLNALEGRAYSVSSYTYVQFIHRVSRLTVQLLRAATNLISFGIWGRIYRDDLIDDSMDLKWF